MVGFVAAEICVQPCSSVVLLHGARVPRHDLRIPRFRGYPQIAQIFTDGFLGRILCGARYFSTFLIPLRSVSIRVYLRFLSSRARVPRFSANSRELS